MVIEQKLNALAAFVLAEDPEEKECARKALTAMMRSGSTHNIQITSEEEDIVHQFLLELGAQPHLLGYRYAVYGILCAAKNPDCVDDLCYRFYPDVAMKFDTTVSRVERGIRHLVEQTWAYGDTDAQSKYFSCASTFKSGKPTNGHFIARSALIVRSRLRK